MTEAMAGLRATGIAKAFAGVPALRGVDLAIAPGEVVGLVGHNGAGKSTLLRAISGATPADSGLVTLDGDPVDVTSPARVIQQGISTVYQELSLLPNLTVTQNVFLGRELRRRGLVDRDTMRTRARELVERFALEVDVDRRLGDYPVATRQLLEIAIAVFRDARYLLLDEPTTALEAGQVDQLLEFLTRTVAETRLGVLLVNHKLDELYAVADTVVALVDGEVRVSGRAEDVSRDQVVAAIAGEEVAAHLDEEGLDRTVEPLPAGLEPSLVVRGVTGPVLRGVDLAAYPGRVLGIYGLVGSGRTELLRTLVGLEPCSGGELELDGAPYRPRDPARAQASGVAYLTEERKSDGIVPLLDARTNVLLPVLDRYTRLGVLQRGRMREHATELMDQMRVRGSRETGVVGLSGGNQQKVLLARILAQRPRLILLDEPTKGVDIAVKTEIHRLLRRLAHEEGLTVVVVSSEEEEVLDVADDVAVLVGGATDGASRLASELTLADLRSAAWAAA